MYFMCVCTYMSEYVCMPCVQTSEADFRPLDIESRVAVSCHVDAEKQSCLLCKSCKHPNH